MDSLSGFFCNINLNPQCKKAGTRRKATRDATLSFSDKANFDEGHMWPTAYALTELTPAEDARG